MASKDKIDEYTKDEKVLTSIIDGITTYTRKDIELENSSLASMYKITVDSIARPIDMPSYFKRTFFGKVIVKSTLNNRVKEVSVSSEYGSQIFKPQHDGQIILDCNDSKKGYIEKECELIILNSFGKQVRIPFNFSYINE